MFKKRSSERFFVKSVNFSTFEESGNAFFKLPSNIFISIYLHIPIIFRTFAGEFGIMAIMTIADIQNLIKNGESRMLELKKTTGELQDGMHSACAMLNSDGGYLIFGVTPSLKITGQQVTDNTKQEIANALTCFEPAIDLVPEYIDVPEHDGNQLIVLHLVPWKWGEEPFLYHGCAYYKPESITKIMPKEMYDERLKAANPQKFEWDIKPAFEVEISDLDEDRIRGAVRAGVRGNRLHASADTDSVEMLLQKLNLLTKDGKPTNAAAMLFAKNARYPQFLLRMCRFRGTTKNVFVDPKEIYGNFFDILDAGIDFCFKHLFLTGEIVGLNRVEKLEIPYEALREALINALCHRDYEKIYASASLAIYDDRVEFINPGRLPVELTPETIFLPHSSYPHNPLIAQVLYLTTFLDKWGSGVGRIMELCQEANVPAPFYSVGTNEVILIFPRRENSSTQKTTQKTEVKTKVKTKVKTEAKILSIVRRNPHVTYVELANALGLSESGIYYSVKKLREKGILRHLESSNGGYWEIVE